MFIHIYWATAINIQWCINSLKNSSRAFFFFNSTKLHQSENSVFQCPFFKIISYQKHGKSCDLLKKKMCSYISSMYFY